MQPKSAASYEEVMGFLYRAPVPVVRIATNGEILMITPPAANLLMQLTGGTFFGNFFEIIETCAPEIRSLIEGFPGSGIICDSLPITVVPNSVSHKGLILQFNIHKIDEDELMVMILDVTDQKQAELDRSLRAAIVDSSDDAIISKNLDGSIMSWNSGAEKIFGFTADEMIGQSITVLIPPELLEEESTIVTAIMQGDKINHFRTVRRAKDGHLLDVSLAVSPLIVDGKIIGISKIARDISERVRFDKALDEAELFTRKLSSAVEQSPVSIMITDTEGTIEYVNPFFCTLTGYTAEEAIGNNPRFLKAAISTPEMFENIYSNLLAGRPWEGEFANTCKDGRLIWQQATIAPITDANGTFTHYISILKDITSEKQYVDALIKAKELAEASNIAKNQFMSNMTHELRTPMNGIMGMHELLLTTDLNEEQMEFLGIIDFSSNNLLNLIDDILEMTQIGTKNFTLVRREFNLSEEIQSVVALHKSVLSEKHLALNVEIAPDVPVTIIGAQSRVSQVLNNVLSNAVKFTAAGAISVVVTVTDTHATGLTVQIAIGDSGIGIAAEALDRIFLPFSQGDNSSTRKYGGTGLGLTISKAIVELLGGTITVKSTLGVGSCFTLTLPFDSVAPS